MLSAHNHNHATLNWIKLRLECLKSLCLAARVNMMPTCKYPHSFHFVSKDPEGSQQGEHMNKSFVYVHQTALTERKSIWNESPSLVAMKCMWNHLFLIFWGRGGGQLKMHMFLSWKIIRAAPRGRFLFVRVTRCPSSSCATSIRWLTTCWTFVSSPPIRIWSWGFSHLQHSILPLL